MNVWLPVECSIAAENKSTPTADMTERFLSEKSVPIMHRLSGPSLFGAAGVRYDFAAPDVLWKMWQRHDRARIFVATDLYVKN